jgi:hypothetical protein
MKDFKKIKGQIVKIANTKSLFLLLKSSHLNQRKRMKKCLLDVLTVKMEKKL